MLLVLGKAIILMWFLKREVSDFPTTYYEIFPFFRHVTQTFLCQICVPMSWKMKDLDDQKVPDSAKVKQAVRMIWWKKWRIRFFFERENNTNQVVFIFFPPRWESWQWKRRWRRWQTELEPGRLDWNIFPLEFYEAFTKYKFIRVFSLHFQNGVYYSDWARKRRTSWSTF